MTAGVEGLKAENVNKKSEFCVESFAPTIWQVMASSNYSTTLVARAIPIAGEYTTRAVGQREEL
ncbi:hypothetical protein [Bartonella sp. B39]